MKKKILSIMLSMVFAVTIASTSVFNTKVAKAWAVNDALVGTKNFNNTSENSAKLGDQLINPEKGWKRYDNTNKNIELYYRELLVNNEQGSMDQHDTYASAKQMLKIEKIGTENVRWVVKFRFKGTKFRLINYTDYHWAGSKMKVTVDGKEDSLNQYVNNVSKALQYRGFVLSYERTGMEYGEHQVQIEVDPNSVVPNYNFPLIDLDAIDIDDNGELLAPMEINKTSTTLPVGASEQLNASILTEGLSTPKNQWFIKWRSNDYNVVNIDDTGKITARKEGKAIITGALSSSSERTPSNIVVQCEVTVTNGQVAVANSIALDQNNVLIGNNSSLNLKATVSPSNAINKKVLWTSSNESIATVDQEGNVKSLGYGQVVITAKIENTDIKATCNVEVSEI